jgi:hypothetical protein
MEISSFTDPLADFVLSWLKFSKEDVVLGSQLLGIPDDEISTGVYNYLVLSPVR